jgi:hypothetical protein
VIRFSHGGTTRDALARFFPIAPAALSVQAGVLSRLLSTIWFACSADASPLDSAGDLFAEIRTRLLRGLEAS